MGLPIKQQDFVNVVPGKTCNISKLDRGDTVDSMTLRLSGDIETGVPFTVSHLAAIRLKLGGKTVIDGISGDEFQIINKYVDRTSSTTYLKIRFSDDIARTISGEEIGGIDTSVGYGSFGLAIDLAPGAGGGDPSLDLWFEISPPKPAGPTKELFRAYLRATEGFQSAAPHRLSPPLGSEDGNILVRMHVFTPNDAIDRIDVKKNGVEIQDEGDKGVIDFMHGEKRTAQAGHICYDPTSSNNQSDAITTVRGNGKPARLDIKATFNQAENIVYVTEVYGIVSRL